MKSLEEIIKDIRPIETRGDLSVSISGISLNSMQISSGSLFIAITGEKLDGHEYINDAITKGAIAIVHEKYLPEYKEGVTYIKVFDTHEVTGYIASAFYDYPSRKLKLVGVTGTNGKTTIATILHKLFRSLGYKAGMMGTVVNKINDDSVEATHTTPDPITLNATLADMVEAGCKYCFMEVSSHAIFFKRINGLEFAGGIFTNLTQDHLDFHKSLEDYRDTKKKFFDMLPASSFALSNIDDANGEYMLASTNAQKYFYSLNKDTDFNERIASKFIGEFNAYNVLAVYASAILLGEDKEKVKEIIPTLDGAPGRFIATKSTNNVTGIVDFAHTPDAVENVLKTINKIKDNGKLITVIGCGGDRDKGKRPIMAKIAHGMSDILILTADNPRSEKVEDILADMQKGLPENFTEKTFIIPDRHNAIQKACELAKSGDYIALLGKGHENYQEVNGVKTHFDDSEELKKCFDKMI
jgi:UDP-N-acetylmuramoyl-L-alanyl-D-glutamate--2,6-diaminopimelate ligase